jgi:HK97 gp10 family phage protein
MADERHVKGLAALQKFLDQLPVKLEKNVMAGSLRAGMNVVKPVAQANVHSVSGELARGLKVSTRSKGGTVTASLKAKGPHGFIARFVEFGTRPHFISVRMEERPINRRLSAKRGELVRASMTTVNRNVLKIGANFIGPTVKHPGIDPYGNKEGIGPHSFMRPAMDRQASAAVVAAAEYMKKRLATKHGLDTKDIVIEEDE